MPYNPYLPGNNQHTPLPVQDNTYGYAPAQESLPLSALRRGTRTLIGGHAQGLASKADALGLRDAAKQLYGWADQQNQSAYQQHTPYTTGNFTDQEGVLGKAEWATERALENVPLLASMAVGGALTRPIGPRAALGTTAGSYQNVVAGENIAQLRADPNITAPPQELGLSANLTAIPQTAIGMATFGTAGRALRAPGSLPGRVAKAGVTGAVTEGGGEALEGQMGDVLQNYYNPEHDIWQPDERINEAVVGGILGGPTAAMAPMFEQPQGRIAKRMDAIRQSGTSKGLVTESMAGMPPSYPDMSEQLGIDLPASESYSTNRDDQAEINVTLQLADEVVRGLRPANDPNLLEWQSQLAPGVWERAVSEVRDESSLEDLQNTYRSPEDAADAWGVDPDQLLEQASGADAVEDIPGLERTESEQKLRMQQDGQPFASLKLDNWKRRQRNDAETDTAPAQRRARELFVDNTMPEGEQLQYYSQRDAARSGDEAAQTWVNTKNAEIDEQNHFEVVPLEEVFRAELDNNAVEDTEGYVSKRIQDMISGEKDNAIQELAQKDPQGYLKNSEAIVERGNSLLGKPKDMNLSRDELSPRMTASQTLATEKAQTVVKDMKEQHKDILLEPFDEQQQGKILEYKAEQEVLEKLKPKSAPYEKAMARLGVMLQNKDVQAYKAHEFAMEGFVSDIQTLDKQAKQMKWANKPVLSNLPKNFDKSKVRNKRIKVYQKSNKGKDVLKVIDPMNLVMKYYDQIPYDSARPMDVVLERLNAGLGAVLGDETLRIRLTEEGILDDTVVWTTGNGGVQFTWGDLNLDNAGRTEALLEKYREQYRNTADADKRAEIEFTANRVKEGKQSPETHKQRTWEKQEAEDLAYTDFGAQYQGAEQTSDPLQQSLPEEGSYAKGYGYNEPGEYKIDTDSYLPSDTNRPAANKKENEDKTPSLQSKPGKRKPKTRVSDTASTPAQRADVETQQKLDAAEAKKFTASVQKHKREHPAKARPFKRIVLPKDPVAYAKHIRKLKRESMQHLLNTYGEGLTTRAQQVLDADVNYNMQRGKLEKTANGWFEGLGLNTRINVISATEYSALAKDYNLDPSEVLSDLGTAITTPDGTVLIYINPTISSTEAQLEVLAHEVGHKVQSEAFDSLRKRDKRAVINAWKTWREGQGKPTDNVSDLLESRMAFNIWTEKFSNSDHNVQNISPEKLEYLLSFNEWFADQVSRWAVTDAKPRSVVEQVFSHIADILRSVLGMVKKKSPTDQEMQKFLDGMWQNQQRHQSIWARLFGWMQNGLKRESMAAPSKGKRTDKGKRTEWDRRGLGDMTPHDRGVLMRGLNTLPVKRKVRELLSKSAPHRLGEVESNPEAAMWAALELYSTGELKVGPQTDTAIRKARTALRKKLTGKDSEGEEAIALYKRWAAGEKEVLPEQTRTQQATKWVEDHSKTVTHLMKKMAMNADEQVRATKNPWLIKLIEQMHTRVGTENNATGMLQARRRWRGRFEETLHDIFKDTDKAFGQAMAEVMNGERAAGSTEEKKAEKRIRALFNELWSYAVEAGMFLNKDGTPIKKVEGYFPRVVDGEYLSKHREDFITMLMQDKYKNPMYEMMGANEQNEEARKALAERMAGAYLKHYGDEESTFDELQKRINQDEANQGEATTGKPAAKHAEKRHFHWIESQDIAPYLSKHLGLTVSTYIQQLVKRGEFVRRFGVGVKGATPIQKYFERARATGASENDIERADKAVQAIMGTLGSDIDPTIQKTQSWLMVWQNLAILPLATLSSMVEPLGMAVRGDIDTAWTGFKAGIREITSKADKTELHSLAEMLGTVERNNVMEALGYEYGGYYMTGNARKVNEQLFRWNGLQSWTRGSRLMALAAAQHFLIKHTTNPIKDSKRWLRELNLDPKDVLVEDGKLKILSHAERFKLQRSTNKDGKAEYERDNRVRDALNQWVDEAILRPDAATRPIWASDPRAALIFHLKSFAFAFWDRVLKRVFSEAEEGNWKPAMLLMSYIPVMLAIEVVRDTIQGDLDDRDDETFGEAVARASERAGLFGPLQFLVDARQDAMYGGTGLESLIGPVAQNFAEILKSIAGSKSWNSTIERSMPLQAAWSERINFD